VSALPALVLLPNVNGWRQPYIQNFVRCLAERTPVAILGFAEHAAPGRFPAGTTILRVEDLAPTLESRIRAHGLRAVRALTRFLVPQVNAENPWEVAVLSAALRRVPARTVIAVDPAAMVAAQLARRQAHLISLEFSHHDLYALMVRPAQVLSVISQSRIRLDALFPRREAPGFVVPNFPIHRERTLASRQEGLVFAGTAIRGFGALAALDFVARYPEYRLHFLGALTPDIEREVERKYHGLLEQGVVSVSAGYLEEDAFIERVSGHRIGLSLYELDRMDDFFGEGHGMFPLSPVNYLLGSPGKAGMYLAAGVPVVASDLPGMKFIQDGGAGILIRESDPESLRRAVETIEADYGTYRRNCFDLARASCFQRALGPFLDTFFPSSAGPS
jgi:hypothetical protein